MLTLISKIKQSSNGAVTTVKTRQATNPAGSASSSVAAQELPDWDVSSDDGSIPVLGRYYQNVDQANLINTHLNAAEVMLGGGKAAGTSRGRGKRGKHGKKGAGELSKVCGNEGGIPWLKNLVSRNVEIMTVETLPTANLIASAGTPQYIGAYFQISNVADISAFSAVFDQYRIGLIEVLIEPVVTEVTAPGSDVGEYISAVDIDDANAPTAYADMGSYSTAVQTRGTQSHYHRFVPTVAVAVYSGAFTSFAATTSMWLDCGSPAIQHYGLKVATAASGVFQTYTYQVKMHCHWRARH